MAYGYLKGEEGDHGWSGSVRFNSEGKRQTKVSRPAASHRKSTTRSKSISKRKRSRRHLPARSVPVGSNTLIKTTAAIRLTHVRRTPSLQCPEPTQQTPKPGHGVERCCERKWRENRRWKRPRGRGCEEVRDAGPERFRQPNPQTICTRINGSKTLGRGTYVGNSKACSNGSCVARIFRRVPAARAGKAPRHSSVDDDE